VAGKRNIESIEIQGGLWANVGETRKSVEERLSDPDYSRKAAGGEWVILRKWLVPVWISDSMIHQELRLRAGVIWKDSDNTEEFLFKFDSENGNNASIVIGEVIINVMKREGEKIINSVGAEKTTLKERLEKLSVKNDRLKSERSKPDDWRDIVRTETIWRSSVKDELQKIEEIEPIKEIWGSFIFSYLAGCISVAAYLLIEPTTLEFFLLFLPVSSIISAIAGYFKTSKRWEAAMKRLRDRI
jgi:hypothetical protein